MDHFKVLFFLLKHNKHIYVYTLHMYGLPLPKQYLNIDTVIDDINSDETDVYLVQLSK